MLYACVRIFDVTSTIENFVGTKHGLNSLMADVTLHDMAPRRIADTAPRQPNRFGNRPRR